jgi:hypothetical protein
MRMRVRIFYTQIVIMISHKQKSHVALLICLACMLMSINAKAQVLEGIQKSFQQYNDHILQEKIYVHTDKDFYLTGEIMWFKLYNVDAGINKPIDISKVAYVDILDDANNPVLQAKIALRNGAGNGSFYIPVTLKNGNYKLRAYTSWMKNFGPAVFFEKNIGIVNPLNEPAEQAKTTGNYDIRFFPEGGILVNGVTSTVAFKATGTDGKGMEINGVIINQRNDTVVRFQALKFGMGSFSFTPDVNNTYKAVVRIGRDNALINDLPPIATSGYAIHLVNNNEVKISTRGHGSGQPQYLIVHSAHQITMAQSVTTDANGNATVQISKEKLGKGINHITLFNSQRQPVCERLYFNRPTDLLTLRATTQTQYKTRNPVSLNITTNNSGGKPLAANMSVSVYKLDSLTNANDADIVSSLWLNSELKGSIESPGYYFDVITSETDKALDNLLLTQGWSRFKWADVLNYKPAQKFTFLPEYSGHIIVGQATNAAGVPTPDILGYLGVIGKRVQIYGANSDSTGRLLFNTKQLYGPGEIVIQTNTERDSTSHIAITSPFSEQYTTNTLPAFHLGNHVQGLLEANSVDMQVQNIYSSAKLKQYYNPAVDSSAFYSNNFKLYKLDDFTRFTTMEEDLREYVAEITVAKQKNRFHINVLSKNGFLAEGDPLVLLDGIPIFNIDKVFTIDPLKIKKLDMINQVYYWGPIFADGLLSFTSYKGDMAATEINPHAVVLDYEGMQLEREFYSPVYQTETQQKSRLPDFRNVLYWSPDVNTNTSGKAGVSFYTSDKPGKYIVVMQGLTADGQAGSYSLKFDVNK